MVRRAFAAAILLILGCHDAAMHLPTSFGPPTKVHAVATVGMVADLVRRVGGDRVFVSQICGSGVDPHLYKPTRDDVVMMMRGDVIFYCGLMLEGKMTNTLISLSNEKPVVAVTSQLNSSTFLQPDGFDGHTDPHMWMDVQLWSQCASTIAESLCELDPAGSSTYEANLQELQTNLSLLHEFGQQSIATIDPSKRVLITSHDAFNYFGRAYGLEVQGIQGISTESEAGLQRINELVDLIVDRGIGAVFIESSVPAKNIEALVEGAAARKHKIRIGGELYSDAMGPIGTYEGTYEGMLNHNLTTVARGLGGQAPANGWRGRLDPNQLDPSRVDSNRLEQEQEKK